MKKATRTDTPKQELQLSEEGVEMVKAYFERHSNTEKQQQTNVVEIIARDMEYQRERIEQEQESIRERESTIERLEGDMVVAREKLEAIPQPTPIPLEVVQADLEKTLALSFVKSVKVEEGTVYITTRANALYTTLDRKYSRSEKWYICKPYKIALPAYELSFSLKWGRSISNDRDGLGIRLIEQQDVEHWLTWITRYNQEPHPHYASGSVSHDRIDQWRGLCLGEYESSITSAFRRSLCEGITELAVYLQSAGSSHAYVTKKEIWALWLGKKEYNIALIPSEKEVATLKEEEEEEENWCECRHDEDDVCDDDDCNCGCHG